jgi:hypothetical protein
VNNSAIDINEIELIEEAQNRALGAVIGLEKGYKSNQEHEGAEKKSKRKDVY